MQAYRIETKISQDGKLSIKGLPFRKGDAVEVIVLSQKKVNSNHLYPLQGKPLEYHKPFESVSSDDWDALK